jgi:hypothetical protein
MLVRALVIGATGRTLILRAGGPPPVVIACLFASRVLLSAWAPIYGVTSLSLRQTITPEHLQGRVNATNRFLQWGTLPVRSLMGGTLGGAIGLRPTIGLAVLGTILAVVWFALSPVRSLRQPPGALGDRLTISP